MDRISTNAMPTEILTKILAYATLPSIREELQPHCVPTTALPAKALMSRLWNIALVCKRFNELAFDAHFQENEQRVRLMVHESNRQDFTLQVHLVTNNTPNIVAYVYSGTFYFDRFGLFADNVQHLGVEFEASSVEVMRLCLRKVYEILMGCESVTMLTVYIDGAELQMFATVWMLLGPLIKRVLGRKNWDWRVQYVVADAARAPIRVKGGSVTSEGWVDSEDEEDAPVQTDAAVHTGAQVQTDATVHTDAQVETDAEAGEDEDAGDGQQAGVELGAGEQAT